MKNSIRSLLSALVFMLAFITQGHATELKSDKSKVLLDNIREDISVTLSTIADIEADQNWTVYLSQSNGKLVRIHVDCKKIYPQEYFK